MGFYLRELDGADIGFINAWRNDREVMESLEAPCRYIAEAVDQAWYQDYLQKRDKAIRLAICAEAATAPIGAVYLVNVDWISRSAEFAICIGDKSWQGQGAGEFATRAILDHAFGDLNLHRVYLTALEANDRAIALYKKAGFVEEGRLREAVFKNGQYMGLVQMSILKRDYLARAKAERV